MGDVSRPGPVERARSLYDLIDSEAVAAQDATTMTAPVSEALIRNNLFNLMIPKELGGEEADMWTVVETIEQISRADASAGWAFMANVSGAGLLVTRIGESAAKAIWGGDKPGICAGMIGPTGTATAVDGGYIINGTVSFASGSGHSSHIIGGALLETADGPQLLGYIIPKEKTECLGNWDVVGLIATGSYDYAVRDQFVPTDYTFFNALDKVDQTLPADRRWPDGLYLERFAVATSVHTGVALGTAERALEELAIIADAGKKRRNALPIAEQQLFQHGFVTADSKLRSSRAFSKEIIQSSEAALATRPNTKAEAHRMHQAGSWCIQVCSEVADFAYFWSGSMGLRNPHPLGRIVRDMLLAQRIHFYVDTTVFTGAFPSVIDSYRKK